MGGCWSSKLARVPTRPSWWSNLQRRGCITSRDLSESATADEVAETVLLMRS
jgi:hypothetical protein